MNKTELFLSLINTAHEAGKAIMEIYTNDFQVENKEDGSPVTKADQASEDIILKALQNKAPQIPIISEEAASVGNIPEVSKTFFLVDPLDGTKEFINKRDEFTINIALIENNIPTYGLIYAPAIQEIYYTTTKSDVFQAKLDSNLPKCTLEQKIQIKTKSPSDQGLTVVTSRSHLNEATKKYLDKYKIHKCTAAGSSLKFCLIAKGTADFYPRLSPTMEWDTAAGHAILQAAGGIVLCEDDTPLLYGKTDKNFKNSGFLAWAGKEHIN